MFEWSETDVMIRDAVRGFIDKEIRPNLDALESGEMTPYPIVRWASSTNVTGCASITRRTARCGVRRSAASS